jgi:hypothetical protein
LLRATCHSCTSLRKVGVMTTVSSLPKGKKGLTVDVLWRGNHVQLSRQHTHTTRESLIHVPTKHDAEQDPKVKLLHRCVCKINTVATCAQSAHIHTARVGCSAAKHACRPSVSSLDAFSQSITRVCPPTSPRKRVSVGTCEYEPCGQPSDATSHSRANECARVQVLPRD